MDSLFSHIFYSSDSTTRVSVKYADILGLPISKASLIKDIQVHPDFPNILAIYDTFRSLGIDTTALKLNSDQLAELPVPFIARILPNQKGSELFTIVKSVSASSVEFLHPETRKWAEIPMKEFSRFFTGVVLIAQPDGELSRTDTENSARKEKTRTIVTWLALSLLPILTVIAVTNYIIHLGANAYLPSLYLVLALLGMAICSLLVWHEIDQETSVVKRACFGGKKVNCDAVLRSSGSKILGLSWGVIGFTYFTGQLLVSLISATAPLIIHPLLGYLSLIASLYILFSVYYQWRIVKQWCSLCLAVQAILFLQVLIFLITNGLHFSVNGIDTREITRLVLAYAIPFFISVTGTSLFRQTRDWRLRLNELLRLKYSPELFSTILSKQKQITASPKGLGIVLGNPLANHHIVKVCNPYCGPCAKAHAILDQILENNTDIQLQIIFTASDKENDARAPIVKHLMAIAETGDETMIKNSLKDWYSSKNKNYHAFAEKYRLNGTVEKQGHKLSGMMQWCEVHEVSYTPTFFLNGYQLPEIYTVDDLRLLLRNNNERR